MAPSPRGVHKHKVFELQQSFSEWCNKGYNEGKPLIVAEGYMDVIRLHQEGLGHAVAPLGTAIGIEHIQQLWRFATRKLAEANTTV